MSTGPSSYAFSGSDLVLALGTSKVEDAELELASAWKAPIVKKFFSLAVAAECEERRVGENGCKQSVARRRRNGVAQHSMLTTSKNSHMK